MTNEELCLRYQAGDRSAGEELVEHNVRYVTPIAKDFVKQFPNLILTYNDYRQEGLWAIVRAAQKYDKTKGPFIAYARLAIRNACYDAIRKAYPRKKLLAYDDEVKPEGSDDSESGFDNENDRINMQIRSTYDTNPERIYLQKERLLELYAAILVLTCREKTWIGWRYGFVDGEPHSLAASARKYHLSESRAGRMEKTALESMRYEMTKRESKTDGRIVT